MLRINETKELCNLAEYIADYLTEELNRQGVGIGFVDSFLIQDALDSYIGGAADHN